MKRVRTLIADDEREARDGLKGMLAEIPAVEVIGTCADGLDAIHKIDLLRPDLVLLDIQMPQADGFEVLSSVQEPLPAVIFVTAHEEFALKAFEVHALDYVVKPFVQGRLEKAIQHATTMLPDYRRQHVRTLSEKMSRRNDEALNVLPQTAAFPGKFIFKADGRVHFLPYESIVKLEAYDYYIKVHTAERYYLVRDSLRRTEQRLPSEFFMRIHKSTIINMDFIVEVAPLGNNDFEVTLTTGERIRASRNYASVLKKWWC